MVGLVALLVIGPEKLPKIARLAGFWLGKTRSMIATVKTEIKEELKAEEMRQLFKEQQANLDLNEFEDILADVKNAAESIKSPLNESADLKVNQVKSSHEP